MTHELDAVEQDRRSIALADTFVALADSLVDDYDVVDLMDQLVVASVSLFDIAAAGLLLIDQRGGLQVVASSSQEAQVLELFQLQSDEGPCLDCIRGGAVVTVADLHAERSRWPRFAAAAAAGGFTSVHAVPLRLRQDVIGGLNLFGSQRAAMTPHEQRLAQALADVATIGVLQQRSAHRAGLLAEQLQTALDSRVAIEQAKGVLAQHGGLDMESAYRALRGYARDHNLKLSALAQSVVQNDVDLDAVVRPRGGAPR
ncbi:MAG: two-component system response regulator [Frankiales bacterium]|jgi:transcriptional regulator with GAF, ATPase, and Fis domain|nr:two-component system response regulator [Frankiales bacterium]